MASASSPKEMPRYGWVLYDGTCGFCSRWVMFWQGVLRRNGFETAALQEPWVASALGVTPDQLLNDLRILTPDRTVIAGADAYRFAMSRIPWAKPIGWLASLPGLRTLFNAGYRWFNRNRYRISAGCRLPH